MIQFTTNEADIFSEEWIRFVNHTVPGESSTVHGEWKKTHHQWTVSDNDVTLLQHTIEQRKTYSCVATRDVSPRYAEYVRIGIREKDIIDISKFTEDIRRLWNKFPESICIPICVRIRNIYRDDNLHPCILQLCDLFHIDEIFHPIGSRLTHGTLYLMKDDRILFSFHHTSGGYVDDMIHVYLVAYNGPELLTI